MNTKEHSDLITEDTPQVFLCTSPAIMPYSVAVHPWFVVNKNGDVGRWELLALPNQTKESWGYIHKNKLPPFRGMYMFPFVSSPHWPTTIRGSVRGRTAEKTIDILESTPEKYPYKDNYQLLGPNSNTYAQWVIQNNPEFELSLPWNAAGKGFL